MTAAARARGEIAIGYQSSTPGGNHDIVINPLKSQKVALSDGGRVIVLSEEQD